MGLWTLSGTIQSLSRHHVPAVVMDNTAMTDGQETEAVALPSTPDGQGLTVAFVVKFASAPATVDYQLQVAYNNVDAEFFDIGSTMTATTGGIVTTANVVGRFARVIANDADTKAVTITILTP